MNIDVFARADLPTVFRVLRTALAGNTPLAANEREFLEAYARIVGYALPSSDPAPIDPRGVFVAGTNGRKRLLQLAAIAALLPRPLRPESVAFVRSLSRHLAKNDPVVGALEALLQGRRIKVRMLTMARMMRMMLRESFLAEGPRGIGRMLAAIFFGRAVNSEKLWKYRRLGLLPEGTLGREYWKHMTEVGFGFPGEKGGIPAAVSYHDVLHVLAGHDTTPMGEIQQACFQGGNRREGGFAFVQFALLQFHQGVKITPIAPPATGCFDPALVLGAIQRGARCTDDFTHQWDFWPLMALPLAEARNRCGIRLAGGLQALARAA